MQWPKAIQRILRISTRGPLVDFLLLYSYKKSFSEICFRLYPVLLHFSSYKLLHTFKFSINCHDNTVGIWL